MRKILNFRRFFSSNAVKETPLEYKDWFFYIDQKVLEDFNEILPRIYYRDLFILRKQTQKFSQIA